jgi:formamidopyrimidine-DNA glycosylase
LQDILYNARLHPKRKVKSLNAQQREACARLSSPPCRDGAGRRTRHERDLFGRRAATGPGEQEHGRQALPTCGSLIVKEAYMGAAFISVRDVRNVEERTLKVKSRQKARRF